VAAIGLLAGAQPTVLCADGRDRLNFIEPVRKRVDASLAQLKKGKSSPDYRRLMDDKIGMLLSLKRLHQIYREADKLEEVEKELKEAGYEQ